MAPSGTREGGRAQSVVCANSGWRASLRRKPLFDRCYRCGVFVVGLLAVLLGGALWLLSVLLAAPAVLAGVWLWSREFHWARRLLGVLSRYGKRLSARVRRRPLRWALITAAGLAVGAGTCWAVL